jgi:hypothetical protein
VITEANQEVEQYAAAVRAALADLPEETRNELLEDLPDHLAEVAAEADGQTLVERLGAPQQYAAELRATLPGGGANGSQQRWAATFGKLRSRALRADTQLGRVIGFGRFSEFGRLLRPAWWVLRGYIAAFAIFGLAGSSPDSLIPGARGNGLVGLLLTVGLIIGSIWLGRRTSQFGRWGRRTVIGASVVAAFLGLIWFAQLDSTLRQGPGVVYTTGNEFDQVQDIYAYDANGNLIKNVRLYDQNGNPITVGFARCDIGNSPMLFQSTRDGMVYYGDPSNLAVAYPYCADIAPALRIPPLPQPTATPAPPAATAVPTAQPTVAPTQAAPSMAPTPQPSPTA